MNKKIVIVGWVAWGASAAARLRRLNENADIVIGSGYVRDEMAENLRELWLKIYLCEAAPHILAIFNLNKSVPNRYGLTSLL